MGKIIFIILLTLSLITIVNAKLDIEKDKEADIIFTIPDPETTAGNKSFNQSLIDDNYLRLDGSNANTDIDIGAFDIDLGTLNADGSLITNFGATNLVGNLICILNNTCSLGSVAKRYISGFFNENVTAKYFVGSGKFLTGIPSVGFTTDQNIELNTTGNPTFNQVNVTDMLFVDGKILSGVDIDTANFFMDIKSTASEQFVARFDGVRSDFAGFQVVSSHTTGQPFVQLYNSVNNDFWTIQMDTSDNFFIKEGTAIGAIAMEIENSGDVRFPISDSFKIGHDSNPGSRAVNLWVVDETRTVIDPQTSAGTVVQSIEQFIARYIGENSAFAGFQVRATSGTSQPFVQLYNSNNNDYYTQQLSVDGDYELRKGTAVGTKVFEADVNNDIHFPLDNQDVFFGLSDDSSITYNASDMVINPKEQGDGELKILGSLDVTENITGNFIRGHLGFHNDSANGVTTVIDSSMVWVNISGFNQSEDTKQVLNGFSYNGVNALVAQRAGTYDAIYTISFQRNTGAVTREYKTGIAINGVIQNMSEAHRSLSGVGDVGSASGTDTLELNVGDNVYLQIINQGGTENAGVHTANLILNYIGK